MNHPCTNHETLNGLFCGYRRMLILLSMLLLGACSTFHYDSPYSQRAVTECIAQGWENSALDDNSRIPVITRDLSGSYLVAAAIPVPLPSGTTHPDYPVWAEVRDHPPGSETEYHRAFQIFHAKLDQAVTDCQDHAEEGAPLPFAETGTTSAAIIEGQFIRHSTFNWYALSVKAIDHHLLILKPSQGDVTQAAISITPGEHVITVALTYNHNGWPRAMTVDMPATLVASKHYILVAIDQGDDHLLELQDKETGENVFHPQPTPTDGQKTIVPPPVPVIVPLMRF